MLRLDWISLVFLVLGIFLNFTWQLLMLQQGYWVHCGQGRSWGVALNSKPVLRSSLTIRDTRRAIIKSRQDLDRIRILLRSPCHIPSCKKLFGMVNDLRQLHLFIRCSGPIECESSLFCDRGGQSCPTVVDGSLYNLVNHLLYLLVQGWIHRTVMLCVL